MPQVPVSPALRSLFDTVATHLQAQDMPRALDAAQRALAAAQTPAERAGAQYCMARWHYIRGELDIAIGLAADVCTTAADADAPIWLARARTLQARCLNAVGESPSALDLTLLAMQGLATAEPDSDGLDEARQAATIALGVIHLDLGDLPAAMQWCERAVELARPLQNQAAYGAAVDTVACVHSAMAARARDAGDAALAEQHERIAIARSTEAVQVAHRIGHVDYESSALLNLAESLTLVGEPTQALTLLQDWARQHPELLPRQRSHLHDSLGLIHLAMGHPAEAVPVFESALAINDDRVHRATITEHLSTALERCGRWQEALVRHKEFHALHAQVSAERAQRNARVAALHLDAEQERARARVLTTSNDQLRRRAEDLQRMTVEDPLTGLANRRHIDALLSGPQDGHWLAIVDVDHFKHINDNHSHAVGDAVLRVLGAILRDNCRPTDTAGRLGGEEFIVLYRGEPPAGLPAAERLRQRVAAHDWSAVAPGLQVTVSIGLAHATEAADGAAMLALADRRLYAAKGSGRNRVVGSG
ncbi:diguanylate cyclase [Variovorax sp. YR752]|uniref:tetratricopeptide repeat-containing diguanylate cyclase n=1 Tax=Variovorax sp. YR752 TaxID=1884383 RepID=UPI003137EFCE